MISAGFRLFDIPFLYGNMFRKGTISCTNYFVMSFVDFLYGMEGHPNLMHSFIFRVDYLMYPMRSFEAHLCRCFGDNTSRSVSDSSSP